MLKVKRRVAERLLAGESRKSLRIVEDMTDEDLVEALQRVMESKEDIVITDGYEKTRKYKEDW